MLWQWLSSLVRYAGMSDIILDGLLWECPVGLHRTTAMGRCWDSYPVYAQLDRTWIRNSISAVLACTCKRMHNLLVLATNPYRLTVAQKSDYVRRQAEISGTEYLTIHLNSSKEFSFEIDCTPDSDSDDMMSEDLYEY